MNITSNSGRRVSRVTTQIFFVLVYVLALAIRNLKWAHAFSSLHGSNFMKHGVRVLRTQPKNVKTGSTWNAGSNIRARFWGK